MKGNFHVQFLGEGVAATSPPYPTPGWATTPVYPAQCPREVAIDHQNGIFAGTNDLVEKIGGRPPMTLEAFIEKHRAAFV